MDFRIADTFTDSLAKLTGEEQKAVKTTAFDLQMNLANPGLQFHKLDKAKDKRFWSVRVNNDIRLIVHRTDGSMLLCYVDHHEPAYAWAEKRKLETHPKTGAAQLVEVRETVQEIIVPIYLHADVPAPQQLPLFKNIPEGELLSYGVPPEWLKDVLGATEDTYLALADHLPREAAEALLELATGGKPQVVQPLGTGTDPFSHPDAQRRFRVIENIDELEAALDFPWEKWAIFLHPAQQELVERDFNGPARVSGSAGTGKTVVALHRAVYLARSNPEATVLLTTFSPVLASMLRSKIRRLIISEPRLGERLEVQDLNEVGRRLYEAGLGSPKVASREDIVESLRSAAAGSAFTLPFLYLEWSEIVDAWQIQSWEQYRDVKRLGRKTRLPEAQRILLWSVFSKVKADLESRGMLTQASLFARLTEQIRSRKHPPFDFVVVDEAQDISVPQLRFLSAMGAERPNALFFAGDLGQRIFQLPFSWKSLGVDVRGRSRTLRINYRTSHQIRSQADQLLSTKLSDVDGNVEARSGTTSVFNGLPPSIHVAKDPEAEIEFVAQWLTRLKSEGVGPNEVGIFVRSESEINRAKAAVDLSGFAYRVIGERAEGSTGNVSVSTMHLAKGLEFRAVAVMACDDEVLPLQSRIEEVTDESDLDEVYNTERHLLYVACTRARDFLLVSSGGAPSEFLSDLEPQKARSHQ